MDCTSSMSPWIDEAKKNFTVVIDQVKKNCKVANMRAAYVGYRDFGDRGSDVRHMDV